MKRLALLVTVAVWIYGVDAGLSQSAGLVIRDVTVVSPERSWVDAGVSLRQLLQALTIDNARAFGLSDDLGTVEVGKRAHLLLLRANPLISVEAYDAIQTVIHAGRPIERRTLSARRN